MGMLSDMKNAYTGFMENRSEIGAAFAGVGQQMVSQLTGEVAEVKQATREKTLSVVEDAKASIMEPFRNVVSSTLQIAKKAVPTALAASASVQYLGGNASFASFLQPVHVRSKFLLIGTDRGATIGYPLEQYQQLSALSGFVMCENVKFDLAATASTGGATLEEQQLIKQYLENGCYIE